MKNFRVLAVLLSLFCTSFSLQAQIESLQISQTATSNGVQFTITNTGPTDVFTSFVIQDNVLFIVKQGDKLVPVNGNVTVDVTYEDSWSLPLTIRLEEPKGGHILAELALKECCSLE